MATIFTISLFTIGGVCSIWIATDAHPATNSKGVLATDAPTPAVFHLP